MQFIVSDCSSCGGWCCRCLSSGGAQIPFWVNLKPSEVRSLNPWIPFDVNLDRFKWVHCKRLSESGLCTEYESRPSYCRTYPNVDVLLEEYLSGMAWFYTPWCFWRAEILELQGIPFTVLETGEQCRQAYLNQMKLNVT